jgi:hypothetical protein
MNGNFKKIFENQSVELSRQVTTERARKAGIVLGDDLGLRDCKSKPSTRYPASIVKKLAGG